MRPTTEHTPPARDGGADLEDGQQHQAPKRGVRTSILAAAALALIAGSAGVGYWHTKASDDDQDRELGPIPVGVSNRLPSFTPADWVTFADYYVVVTITGEKEQEPEPDDGDPSTGTIGREVNVRIDKVLWQRPSATRPGLPRTLTWPGYGWSYDSNGRHTPRVAPGSVRQTVGHSYALPIVKFPEGWGELTTATVREYKDGRIYGTPLDPGDKPNDRFNWSNPGPKGKPVQWMVARLRSTHPWKVCQTKQHHDSASYTGVMQRSSAVNRYRDRTCPQVHKKKRR